MEKIFNIAELKLNLSKVQDCIVIPYWILDKMIDLCKMEVEYAGQLLCYKRIVEYPFISAAGTIGSVFPGKKVVFNSDNYSAIEFHTHTASLGNFWTNKFSWGDLMTFNKRIEQEGNGYQHILFTTDNILTWGKIVAPEIRIGFGNTETVITKFDEINSKHNCWK